MKYLIILIFSFGACTIGAQVPNMNFEEWFYVQMPTGDGGYRPVGWNSRVGGDMRISTDAAEGKYAITVNTWYTNDYGVIFNGAKEFNYGTPLQARPTALTGMYKHQVVPVGDSARVLITLRKYNAAMGRSDTIGIGKKALGASEVFIPFEAPVTYKNGEMPDTIGIAFFSGFSLCAKDSIYCAYLTIDALRLEGVIATAEQSPERLSISPNPTSDFVRVSDLDASARRYRRAEVADAQGRMVKSCDFPDDGLIDLRALPAGIYTIRLYSDDQHLPPAIGKAVKH